MVKIGSRSRSKGQPTVKRLWCMVFRIRAGREARGWGGIRIGFGVSSFEWKTWVWRDSKRHSSDEFVGWIISEGIYSRGAEQLPYLVWLYLTYSLKGSLAIIRYISRSTWLCAIWFILSLHIVVTFSFIMVGWTYLKILLEMIDCCVNYVFIDCDRVPRGNWWPHGAVCQHAGTPAQGGTAEWDDIF